MARIRSIKPEFPQSESMGRVSRDARLLFAQLWTFCDDEGRSRAAPKLLASQLFPYDDDAPELIGKWLQELESECCIMRYRVGVNQYLQVVNWEDHQRIDKPSKSRLPSPDSRTFANIREASRMRSEGSCGELELELEGNGKGRGIGNGPAGEKQIPEASNPIPEETRKPPIAETRFFRSADVDGTTDAVLKRLGEINAEAKRSPTVSPSAVDRDKLSDAIGRFGRLRCENLWHWSINSPHPRAKFFRQKALLTVRQIFDPEKVGELLELSEAPDAWAAEIRDGPSNDNDAIDAQIKAAIEANSKPGTRK